jgi:hypothetical protein
MAVGNLVEVCSCLTNSAHRRHLEYHGCARPARTRARSARMRMDPAETRWSALLHSGEEPDGRKHEVLVLADELEPPDRDVLDPDVPCRMRPAYVLRTCSAGSTASAQRGAKSWTARGRESGMRDGGFGSGCRREKGVPGGRCSSRCVGGAGVCSGTVCVDAHAVISYCLKEWHHGMKEISSVGLRPSSRRHRA